MVDIITLSGSDFKPDSKLEYSNSNFVLLTYILEKIFDKSYSQLLKEYITQPLGLVNTYLGGKINTSKNECKSYSYTGTWKAETETDISIPLGAGGIVSTPGDLIKFSDALFSGKLLKNESLELMKTFNGQYGMGLFQIPFYERISYGHTGGIDGFSSVFSYFSDGDISYALTSNGTNYNNNNISIAILSAIFKKPYEIPDFSTYEVSPEELDKYKGVYASTQIPIKITITRENNTLIAQGTGQPNFPLEATGKDMFKFDQAGIIMEFDTETKTMVLKQGGVQFEFVKE
jgi:CubicO group peptidase (beta-lactamase class C family)